jgi:colanic acid biosynthesis glycosyl transferase WcaI
VFDGWKNRLLQVEHPAAGLRVFRLGTVARSRARGAEGPPGRAVRALAFLWFSLASAVLALGVKRPQLVFAVLQPLTIGPLLWLASRLRGARVVFNVQDLHPDALVDLGLIKSPLAIRCLRVIESWCYRRAEGLAVICEGFREHCVARGARASSIRVIPNWIDLDEIKPLQGTSELRQVGGADANDFVVLYAGTIGLASGAEVIVEAAALLRADAGIRVLFVGEGQLLPRLRQRAGELGLQNVAFLPFQERNRLNHVQSAGDVSLVTLLPGHGRTSVPSKVLGYLAAGRPVIAAVDDDSETARFVTQAQAGVVVAPGDAHALAAAILAMRKDPDSRKLMGHAGRRYLEEHCSKQTVLQAYGAMLGDLAK